MPKDESLLGKVMDVLITSAGKHYMKCSVISNMQPLNIPSPLPKGHISGVQAVPMVGRCSLFFEVSVFNVPVVASVVLLDVQKIVSSYVMTS